MEKNLYKLKLDEKNKTAKEVFHLIFEADSKIVNSFTTPGQVIEIKKEDERNYFAIASKLQTTPLELLVKKSKGISTSLCDLVPGEKVQSSLAFGRGFDLNGMMKKSLHLFSMGTGIAAFRPLIYHFINGEVPFSNVTLWQGSSTKYELPFQSEYKNWETSGIKIIKCLSQEDPFENVSNCLKKIKPNLNNSKALCIGSQDFFHEITEICLTLGLCEGDLKTNF